MKATPKKIHDIRENAKKKHSVRYIHILKNTTGHIMPLVIFTIIITIFIKFSITLTPSQQNILMIIDKIVIFIFTADLITDYTLCKSKTEFLKKRWYSFIILLPLFNIIGRLGTGFLNMIHIEEIISKSDKSVNMLKFLENNAINPALKAGHITNISARLARSSYIIERLKGI